ncbi:pyridoxamine 5'-phosphate oxidase family protein [Arthrobacter sp. VKM Ac-2550]|uniref:pyridoxamine 5'-phosphate oxidase family protein n=1 Tax=Crystallibacter permensis TaxID=1938888 RepID=UPI0022279393|nr:pyridoxamine 5'-phosphate oxidase family protein [Arthrobacter sp. VKM Ac-2550]MCW2134425.1 Nitroimidazol reductase NimA, pyridoxamine 5'-phosphate oxidase superfamily [Arthrobacter sp. VKM Ac-2550]
MPRHPNGPPSTIPTENVPAGDEPDASLPAIPDLDNPVIELTEDECWDLLIGTMLGRLAVSVADKPELYPVNFLAHDRRILIRTMQGTKLVSMAINNKVALEADGRSLHSVWSVVVKGTVRELTTEAEITTAEQLSLRSWTASVKTTYVEITPSRITGRRIALADEFKLER